MASIAAQVKERLREAVTDARDEGCTWPQIATLPGGERGRVKRRYAHHAKTRTVPFDLD